MTRVPTHRLSPAAGTTSSSDDGDWRDRAACLGEDGELFFPDNTGGGGSHQTALAKSVCAACPVRDTCLSEALQIDAAGIWGGHTEDERRAMTRAHDRRNPTAVPTVARKTPVAERADPNDRPTCGTHTGYAEHTRKRERQCDACRDWKAGARTPTDTPHGTVPAYRRHLANDEEACPPCKAAKAANSAHYRRQARRAA